jgi:hypothetical protein
MDQLSRISYLVDSAGTVWHSTCHFLWAATGITMLGMAEFRSNSGRQFGPAAFSFKTILRISLSIGLGISLGCVRSGPLQAGGSPSSRQTLPFHSDSVGSVDASGGSLPVVSDAKQASNLPFHPDSQSGVVPAGTLLTVRLDESFSAAKIRAGDTFAATVAAPVTIDGKVLVPRDTSVTGRVESARSLEYNAGEYDSGRAAGSGYFRLNLNSINIGDRQLALQTSSLFARETSLPARGIGVQKGRYLTFRLKAPVTVGPTNSTPTLEPATSQR